MTVKSVAFARFRPGMTVDEGRRYWSEVHAELALKVPGVDRYVQDHWEAAADGGEPVFHGDAEIWFADEATFVASLASPEWAALGADGPNIFDRPSIVAGLVDEHVIMTPDRTAGGIKTIHTVKFDSKIAKADARRRWFDEHASALSSLPGLLGLELDHGVRALDPTKLDEETVAFGGRFDGFYAMWFASERDFDAARAAQQWDDARQIGRELFESSDSHEVQCRELVLR